MSAVVTLHREDGGLLGEPLLLVDLVRRFVEAGLGFDAGSHGIAAAPVAYPAPAEWGDSSLPPNLTPDIGHVLVIVTRAGLVVYRHPHTLTEVVKPGLQAVMARLSLAPAGFQLLAPGLTNRAAPVVPAAMPVVPFARRERSRLRLRAIEEAPPPAVRWADLAPRPAPQAVQESDDGAVTSAVKVVVHDGVYQDLRVRRRFSSEMEDGGFVVGRVFADADQPGTYIAEVTGAPEAEHTGATLVQFTYTGDSFAAVKQQLAEQGLGERLLGWYHTHPFPATPAMGLSSLDLYLHFTTFRIPWQLAALVNLDPGGDQPGRVLRFYVREGDTMKRCRTGVVDGRR